jgi:predicted PurR-regulated permease PerM
MEIVYFVLGIVAVLLVLGVVVIVRMSGLVKKLNEMEYLIEGNFDSTHRRIDDETRELALQIKNTLDAMGDIQDILHKRIDDEIRDVYSQLDSRLDKLENRMTLRIPPTNDEVLKELEKVREEFLSLRQNL